MRPLYIHGQVCSTGTNARGEALMRQEDGGPRPGHRKKPRQDTGNLVENGLRAYAVVCHVYVILSWQPCKCLSKSRNFN